MGFNFKTDTPIYLQIIDHIKTEIIKKNYKTGEKLPSVREFSVQFEVNPNTVQKALFELEEMGIIITERTNGKFVTKDESVIEAVKKQSVAKIVEDFYNTCKNLGVEKTELIELLNNKE